MALSFSHTHTAPKVIGASDNIFSEPIPPDHQQHIDRYTADLTRHLKQVADEAVQDLQPGHLAWGIGKVSFAMNRRTPGGPVDHDLPTLVVRDAKGTIRAILVTYACHCVTLSENKIGGDWAGYAQEALQRKFPSAVGLVSIGCGSDANPDSGVTGDQFELAAAQGAQIADEADRVVRAGLTPLSGSPHAVYRQIELPLNDLPSRPHLEELAQQPGIVGYNARTQIARLDRGEALLDHLTYPVQTWTLGDDLAIVFLGGEVCVDYALRLRRELRQERLWLNGYSNDFCSYIPSERLLQEGGYGGGSEVGYFSLPTTLKAGLEDQIVEEVIRQLPPSFAKPGGTNGVPPLTPEESRRSLRSRTTRLASNLSRTNHSWPIPSRSTSDPTVDCGSPR